MMRFLTAAILISHIFTSVVLAADSTSNPSSGGSSSVKEGSTAKKPTSANAERNFYEVMDDLLADFEYDLKNGTVTGLKDLSIRNIATSENIPPSFRSHLELSVTEKILKNTRTRMVQCLPCRAKRTTLNGDQVIITSADTNPVELSRIAKMSGILHFLDMAFSYQPSGMVLSMTISEPESGGIIWSRSYNSETSRTSAFRRGVDYAQIDDARKASEYQPTVQYRAIAYYLFENNIGGYTGCIGAGFRMVERYDNRKKEVGFEANYLKDSSTLVNTAASTANLYSGFNLTMLFVHSWNFIGPEENYNLVRGGLTLGLGGTYTSGYLGGLLRATYEWRFAKHWALSTVLGYRPTSTAFIAGTKSSISGAEFGLGINAIF